jgi:hypothetical protein
VNVPERVAAAKLKPGTLPLIEKVYGLTPPAAEKACEYDSPITPVWLVISGLIVMLSAETGRGESTKNSDMTNITICKLCRTCGLICCFMACMAAPAFSTAKS